MKTARYHDRAVFVIRRKESTPRNFSYNLKVKTTFPIKVTI